MGDNSDIEELLNAYRRDERKGKSKPAIAVVLTLVGSIFGLGVTAQTYLSKLFTAEQGKALETHMQEVEKKLEELKANQSPGEGDQNRRIDDAQQCCNSVSRSLSDALYPNRRSHARQEGLRQ